jgi:hypothetical protein
VTLDRLLPDTRGYDAVVGVILAAPAGGRVSVRVDGATLSLPLIRSYAPTVGDTCLVLRRESSGWVLGALGTAPPAAPPPTTNVPPPVADDPTAAKPRTGSDVFVPTSSGTYRDGAWLPDTVDVYQGDASGRGLNYGAAYYGAGPNGIRGATVTRARLRIRRQVGGSSFPQAPTLRLLTGTVRPAGAPVSSSSTPGPALAAGEETTYDLPTSWGQALVDGTAGGIGTWVDPDPNPYIRTDGPTLAVLLDWTRST